MRHEPQPAQHEEGRANERQVDPVLLDDGASVGEIEGSVAADPLDVGVDADAGRVGCIGHAQPTGDAGRGRRREVAALDRRAQRRLETGAGHRLQPQGDVARRARHRPADLQRVPRPAARRRRHQAHRRAQTGHAAERRRDPERAAEVGALGQCDHAGGQGHSAAAGRSTGALGRVPRIAGGAEHLVEGVAAGGELRAVGLADDDRAGTPEPRDHGRVLGGHVVGEQRRPVGGAHAGHRCDVLDADRQPAQQARCLASRQRLVHRPSLVVGAVVHRDDRVQHRVELRDPFARGLQHLARRHLTCGDEVANHGGWTIDDRHRRGPLRPSTRR